MYVYIYMLKLSEGIKNLSKEKLIVTWRETY